MICPAFPPHQARELSAVSPHFPYDRFCAFHQVSIFRGQNTTPCFLAFFTASFAL